MYNKMKQNSVKKRKTKSRQGMPRKGYARYTIIIKKKYLEKIKKIQKETGKTIREIMDEILSEYFEKRNDKMNITKVINLVSIAKFHEYDALNKINYNNSYTRKYTWKKEQQKLFIDSIINEYPIPGFIFKQKNNDNTDSISFDIIDGKQRLLTLKKFINNEFTISINNTEYYFKDLNKTKKLRDIKNIFWQYTFHSECIITNSEEYIKEIIYRIHK